MDDRGAELTALTLQQLLRRGAEASNSKDLVQRLVRLTIETNALTGENECFR